MDLKTMKVKIDNKQYANPQEIRADFQLMCDNCFKYNNDGQVVHHCGKELLKLFNQKWNSMPDEPAHVEETASSSTAHHSPVSGKDGGLPSPTLKSPKGASSGTSPAALIANLRNVNDDDQIDIVLMQVQEEQTRVQEILQQLQNQSKDLLTLK